MAKAIQAFFGTDTYGSHINVAQREDGVWFARWQHELSINGLIRVCWSKWTKHPEPIFLTKEKNVYSDEYIDLPEGKFIEWGFNKLEKIDGPLRYRLPKGEFL